MHLTNVDNPFLKVGFSYNGSPLSSIAAFIMLLFLRLPLFVNLWRLVTVGI